MLALESAGHRVTVASLNPPPNSFRHERLASLKAEAIYPPPGVVLDAAPEDTPEWRAMQTLAAAHETAYGPKHKPLTRARNAMWMAPQLRRRGVQHIHVHFANRATHTALFLKKAGLTFSFTAHAQDFMVDLGSDDLLREMIREAEFVIAVSDFSRQLLVEKAPDHADKIIRIYNGIDASRFPAALPGEHGMLRIVSVGRLIEFKGFHHLIAAVAELRKREIEVSLSIIGEGPQREELAAQIAELGLGASVTLRGVLGQEEIKRELAAADVFALACIVDRKGASDILPTVILEAMATGLPVVSTFLAGVPELVGPENGILTLPGDIPAMADALARLAEDPELRSRMGQAGLDRVQRLFSLEKTAGEVASRFQELLAGRFAPEVPAQPIRRLCLLGEQRAADATLEAELRWLEEEPSALIMAVRTGSRRMEYFPDAMVMEGIWRSEPALAAKAESLRKDCADFHGEEFFTAARRAVYLAVLHRRSPWQEVHAMRADMVLTAWLVSRLTGSRLSGAVQRDHGYPSSTLGPLVRDFTSGSVSDPRLKSPLRDPLRLLPPPPPRRVLGIRLRPAPVALPDTAGIWRGWLQWQDS